MLPTHIGNVPESSFQGLPLLVNYPLLTQECRRHPRCIRLDIVQGTLSNVEQLDRQPVNLLQAHLLTQGRRTDERGQVGGFNGVPNPMNSYMFRRNAGEFEIHWGT
ncbi:hypothetical protein M413DRAFT_275365 [Hebeloma cylindrosporum]|uniref:Uncharacterized protein n=1 Tax=Hebeloma cylindrosporum TaxID=76867 RepID=A0A0C3BZL4_HEBCY|nr:hypothetical protein M413DRAFT_275365 [Hebeloma cylindrosporum h7]